MSTSDKKEECTPDCKLYLSNNSNGCAIVDQSIELMKINQQISAIKDKTDQFSFSKDSLNRICLHVWS